MKHGRLLGPPGLQLTAVEPLFLRNLLVSQKKRHISGFQVVRGGVKRERERERERGERATERDTERETETERDRDSERERERERQREIERERGRASSLVYGPS